MIWSMPNIKGHTQPKIKAEALSHYPLNKYLSPSSQKSRRKKAHNIELSSSRRLLKRYAPPDIVLNDEQHKEMAHFVEKIESVAKDDLEQIFREADNHCNLSNIQQAWEDNRQRIKNLISKSQVH